MVRAIAVHGSATIDGRREKRPPAPSKTQEGGILQAVVRSPAMRPSLLPAPGTPSLSQPPTLLPSSSSRPALSLVHPALSSGPDHPTPHPRQEFHEPLLAAPPSPPTATTTPTTSALLTPRGTVAGGRHAVGGSVRVVVVPTAQGRRVRKGCRTPAPCHSRDHAAARSGTSPQLSIVVVIVVRGVGRGGSPVAGLPGGALRAQQQPARGRH